MPNPVFNGMGNVLMKALGESAQITYTKQAGGTVDLNIIFNEKFIETGFGGTSGQPDVPFTTPYPVAWIKQADVPDARSGDTFTLDGVDWEVRAAEPDALELTKLLLSRV